jgi:hypothetical protein
LGLELQILSLSVCTNFCDGWIKKISRIRHLTDDSGFLRGNAAQAANAPAQQTMPIDLDALSG